LDKNKKNDRNVIPLPQLEQRLLVKGRDLLEHGDLEEALQLLLQAEKMDDNNPEILYTLIAAYIKKGDYKRAKIIVERLLNEGIGDYFHAVEIYIPILFHLDEYKKIVQLITLLSEEDILPIDKRKQYEDLKQLCERIDQEVKYEGRKESKFEGLLEGNLEQITRRISSLDKDDIHFYLEDIKEYLIKEEMSPFIKTLLFSSLLDLSYMEPVKVRKYGREVDVIPGKYDRVGDVPFYTNVRQKISRILENDNPILKDFAITICDHFFFYIYPLEADFSGEDTWAEAFMIMAKSYLNQNFEEAPSEKEDSSELKNAIEFIQIVEQNFNL